MLVVCGVPAFSELLLQKLADRLHELTGLSILPYAEFVHFTVILALLLSSGPQAQGLESARFGSLDADVGALSILHHYDGATDKGLGAAFLQLRYRSPEWAGARLGAWWLGLGQLGESHPGDYDALCETSQALRELNVTFSLPGPLTSSRLQVGRFDMRSTAMDGNSHQGIAWQFASGTDLRPSCSMRTPSSSATAWT